ncbi:MAG: metallophosphoesterase [Promethearchaeota archaeon]
MNLKLLAISDTHLGEDTSFLSFPSGLHHLWDTLKETFGSGASRDFTIDELILIGDIPDTALSSTSQVITQTNAFIQTLGSAANIEKTVYIPGNHDHTLWTEYMKLRHGNDKKYHVTDPKGELIIEDGELVDNPGCKLLSTIFYGFPYGPAWEQIRDSSNNFVVSNPLYAVETPNRNYIFTHGTHFKNVVTAPQWLMKFVDYIQVDRLIAKININTDYHVENATTFEQLEEYATPFVDSLWISSRNQPTSRSDHLWYLFHVISNRFEEKRDSPEDSTLNLFPFIGVPAVEEEIIAKLNGSKSIKLLKKFFLDLLLSYLDKNALLKEELTFVYGDIHDGGWGNIERENYITLRNGRKDIKLRIFNCGAWVVHSKDRHPPCHVFAVDEAGKEYLLDVSFKGVNMLGMSLLELAAKDFENRSNAISAIIRFIMDRFD